METEQKHKVYLLPSTTSSNRPLVNKIETLVDKILAAKKKDPNADTSALEREIDKMVYELYGLTDEEIEIVEGRRQKRGQVHFLRAGRLRLWRGRNSNANKIFKTY